MKEATVGTVDAAEKPKTTKHKEGTVKAPVDGASPEGVVKVKATKVPKDTKFRILAGVDITKFRGQRQQILKAALSLGDGFFSAEEIAAKVEGYNSKAPVVDSALWHLKGLVANQEAEAQITEKPAPVVENKEAVAA